jgi:hypothetical protein
MASPFLWSPNAVFHEKDRSPNEKLRSTYTFVHRNKALELSHKGPWPGRYAIDAALILLPLALTLLYKRDSMELNSQKLFWDVLNNFNLKLYALRHYTERLERLERDRDSLLKS